MTLKLIWTLDYLSLSERLRRTRDWAAWKIAGNLPLRIRYLTTIGEIGKAVRKSPDIPATPLSDVLQNLEAPKNMS